MKLIAQFLVLFVVFFTQDVISKKNPSVGKRSNRFLGRLGQNIKKRFPKVLPKSSFKLNSRLASRSRSAKVQAKTEERNAAATAKNQQQLRSYQNPESITPNENEDDIGTSQFETSGPSQFGTGGPSQLRTMVNGAAVNVVSGFLGSVAGAATANSFGSQGGEMLKKTISENLFGKVPSNAALSTSAEGHDFTNNVVDTPPADVSLDEFSENPPVEEVATSD